MNTAGNSSGKPADTTVHPVLSCHKSTREELKGYVQIILNKIFRLHKSEADIFIIFPECFIRTYSFNHLN
jgi:hypothetical protein